ncbi:Heterokaryon incompatibility protein (HET) domain containing protein [Naviculisporaceae sp. PSN 640]
MLHSWLSRHFAAPDIATAPKCNTLPTFKYESLPANRKCFRVFHLEPRGSREVPTANSGGNHQQLDGCIRGHLSVVYLDQAKDTRVQYEALSYCWEDSIEQYPTYKSNDKDMIELHQEREDGTRTAVSQFAITRTLSTALRYLRARTGTDGPLPPMFIDQICINQGDTAEDQAEKSHQVSLMGDIYRHCARVVAWLGVATEQTDAFFDFAAQLNDHQCEGLVYNPKRLGVVHSVKLDPGKRNTVLDADYVLKRDIPQMVALARRYWPSGFPHRGALEVYLRRWFRRIWIIQEACLPPEMIFVCGSRSCSVRDFGSVVTFHNLVETLWSWQLEGDPTPPPLCPEDSDINLDTSRIAKKATHLAFRILRVRWRTWTRLLHWVEKPRGLAGLVTEFNVDTMAHGSWVRLGSSMPHDYIYALMGLVSEEDPVAAGLVPNYQASAQDTFTNFTRLVIDPAIDTLLLSQRKTKKIWEGLPSWVPDYSSEDLALPRGYRPGRQPMFAAGRPDGDPSRDSPKVDSGSPPGILRAKGILLCEVDRVGVHSMQLPPPTTREPRYIHLYLGFQMAVPLPWWSRKIDETFRTPLPSTIFSFFREVREFCELAAASAVKQGQDEAKKTTGTGSSFPTSMVEEDEGRRRLDEAIWLTTTGGHGLPSNIKQSPLGPPTPSLEGQFHYGQEDKKQKPLLGRLWDLQLSMDALPTIMRRRRISLATLASSYYAAMECIQHQQSSRSIFRWFSWLLVSTWFRAALVYLAGRLWIEARHVFWCWRFFVASPFIEATHKDHLYWGIFGKPATKPLPTPGLLTTVLKRHVGRCCFMSKAGHVGLAPAGVETDGQRGVKPSGGGDRECDELGAMPGDLVVVLLGMTTPIVLRPGSTPANPCTYIGEAYCHGFMNGEALRGKVEADMPWFEIG